MPVVGSLLKAGRAGARLLGRAVAEEAPAAARTVGKTPGLGTKLLLPVTKALERTAVPEARTLSTLFVGARNVAAREGGQVFDLLRPHIRALDRAGQAELAAGLQGMPTTRADVQAILGASQRYFDAIGSTPQDLLQAMIHKGLQPSRKFLRDGNRLAATLFDEAAQERATQIVTQRGKPLIQQMRQNGVEPAIIKFATDAMRQFRGVASDGGTFNEVLSTARALNVATLLGRAVIPNLSQPILSTMTGGLKNTIKGSLRTLTNFKDAESFATRSGAAFDAAVSEFMRGEALGGRSTIGKLATRAATSVLRSTLFLKVERLNRILASNIGREFIPDIARRAALGNDLAVRQLQRFGLNGKQILQQGGRLTESQLATGVQNFVRKTQFRVTPEELPLFASDPQFGPIWRTVFQFKTFSLKATELLLEEAKINPRGLLARGLPLAALAGEGVQTLRGISSGKSPEEVLTRDTGSPGQLFLRSAQNVAAVGLLGIFWDALQAATFEGGLGEFAAGPTVSSVAELGEGAVQAVQGRPQQLRRTLLRRVPAVGPAIERATR